MRLVVVLGKVSSYKTENKDINRPRGLSYEPRCEETGLRDFRPGPIQTGLYSHRR